MPTRSPLRRSRSALSRRPSPSCVCSAGARCSPPSPGPPASSPRWSFAARAHGSVVLLRSRAWPSWLPSPHGCGATACLCRKEARGCGLALASPSTTSTTETTSRCSSLQTTTTGREARRPLNLWRGQVLLVARYRELPLRGQSARAGHMPYLDGHPAGTLPHEVTRIVMVFSATSAPLAE